MKHETKKHGKPKAVAPKPALRRFHQARWDEPIIFELSAAGQRGVLPPEPEAAVVEAAGDVFDNLPESLKRKSAPALPEMSQLHVLRHYARLSQENLGVDLNVDVGQGTCTMKYSPKVNDQLARSHKLTELHPLQPLSSVQGILEVMYKLEGMLKEISGMERVTLQPGAGSAAIYANISMIRAYHEARGEGAQRTEVITTAFSHPSNGAAAKVAGYKIITLPPDADGCPDFEALKAAVSER
ncbi:MAG: glycine dehydrogenase subunit 2, partial [Chloroflexi bacterium]